MDKLGFKCSSNLIAKNNFELEIDFSKILVIKSLEDFITLSDKYAKPIGVDLILNTERVHKLLMFDWVKLAADYAGIEIQNYPKLLIQINEYSNPDKGFRCLHNWLRAWDCSSGCIWDLNAIINFQACDINLIGE